MDYRTQIQSIRSRFLHGDITYAEAKAEVEPLLDEMNVKGEAVAKKNGFTYRKLKFGYVFR